MEIKNFIKDANTAATAILVEFDSPESARKCYDEVTSAIYEGDKPLGVEKTGFELVQAWPVDRFFTISVDAGRTSKEEALSILEDYIKNVIAI